MRPVWPKLISVLFLVLASGVASAAPTVQNVRIGFAEKYKLGYWTPIWITIETREEPFDGQVELLALDGEGTETEFRAPSDAEIHVEPNSQSTVTRYVKFGRPGPSLTVRLRTAQSTVRTSFGSGEIPQPLTSDVELFVSFGGDVGVDRALQSVRRRTPGAPEQINCVVQSADQLPDHWLGYDGVQALVLATSDLNLIGQLSESKIRAISLWVSMGGHLVLSVGANGEELLAENMPLATFVPGRFVAVQRLGRTNDIEQYVKASQRLDTLPGGDNIQFSSIRDAAGQIESQETSRAGQGPTIVRSPCGFGQTIFVAIDLDQPPLTQWQSRAQLVANLLHDKSQFQTGTPKQQTSGKVAHEGYDDIVGQLRVALDRFTGVTLVSFTAIATLTVLYILLIGPGDYFLLRKLVGRMEWTWVTFPLIVITFCGISVALVRSLKDSQMRINQVELIDIDASSSTVRGTVWTQMYSPQTDSFNLTFEPEKLGANDSPEVLLSWQGLPGDGLGGMNSRSINFFRSGGYTIFTERDKRDRLTTRLADFPIQVASSRSLGTLWRSNLATTVESDLQVDRRDDTLYGSFTNPLDVELSECVLTFGRWSYRLNDKLGPRETIAKLRQSMSERSLNMYLTRRNVEEKRSLWDPTSGDVPRIVEIMMYHDEVRRGGYTELRHRFQAHTDLTDHLSLSQAILTGWTNRLAGHLARDGKSLAQNYDRHWTFYRIVFPVKTSVADRFR